MVQRKLHADLHLCQASERGSSSWWIWGEEHKTWQTECWELGFFRASMRRGRGDFQPFFTAPCPPTFQWRLEDFPTFWMASFFKLCSAAANRGWGVWCSVPWRTYSWPSLIGCDLYVFITFVLHMNMFIHWHLIRFESISTHHFCSELLNRSDMLWNCEIVWSSCCPHSFKIVATTHTHTYECK